MSEVRPTAISGAIFRAKAAGLQLRRAIADFRHPVPLHAKALDELPALLTEIRSPLWPQEESAERAYQLGKVQNLRVAALRLDGIRIPKGQLFSFWRQVGRATRRRGFVPGRMLREGCFLPSVGGGLCQLSNALYQAAAEAGCQIVERHAHSRVVPGSEAAVGRDATVAWNYVDLRFCPTADLQLRVQLTRDELIVGLYGAAPRRLTVLPVSAAATKTANNCFTCGDDDCVHHSRAFSLPSGRPREAVLVDENWPEFRAWVAGRANAESVLMLPIDGERFGIDRYRWPSNGYGVIKQAPWAAAMRSWQARRLSAQGAARQSTLLDGAAALARAYARQLTPDITRLVIAQSLLPFLWRDGHLGGRVFSVLMTRHPIAILQSILDNAAAQHPACNTLRDFRAPAWLAAAEAEALAAADAIVTPHAAIAQLFGDRATLLPWDIPAVATVSQPGDCIGFPGPAVARRGAYEVRDAARAAGLRVAILGRSLEGPDFWSDLAVPCTGPAEWLRRSKTVVLPAYIEHQPRLLLHAIGAGVPVIATRACGLPEAPGLTLLDSPADLAELLATPARL